MINLNSEIISISQELIKEINKDSDLIIFQEIKNNPFLIELNIALQACKIFSSYLDEIMMNDLKKQKNSKNEKIIKLGTSLIFQLRQLITGESLQFVLAGNTTDGTLKEKIYSQDEIFSRIGMSNFRISFSNARIELASAIEKLSALDDVETSLAEQWKKILEYGFTSDYNKEEAIDRNEGLFHKNSPDINVYMKFITTEKRKTLSYYYMLNGEKPNDRDDLKKGKSYNRGWLYQWLKINQNIEIDDSSLTPLLPLMSAQESRLENIAGIKSGDRGTEQYKYRNRKIISLNNIQEILNGSTKYIGIINSLELLFNNLNSPHQGYSQLMKDFTTLNQDQITDFVSKRIDELKLNDLTKEKIFDII